MKRLYGMKWMASVLVCILLISSVTTALAAPDANVAGNSAASGQAVKEVVPPWAEQAIRTLKSEGIVQGYEDGNFQPGRLVTRAELVAMIRRAAQALNVPDAVPSVHFRDVQDEWYAEDVDFAVRKGWIDGFEDDTFRPDAPVNRQETAVVLNRILKLEGHSELIFRDASDIPAWSGTAVAALTEAGLLSGYPDGTFQGKRTLTRAEAAVLLYRLREQIKDRLPQPLTVQVKTEDGTALADANVSLHREGKRSVLQWAHTDASGRATFQTTYGSYEIAAYKTGWAAHQAVQFNQDTAAFNLQAVPAAEFSGRLLGEDGKPAAGVFVGFTTNPTFLTVTDADGTFHVFVLPDRDYHMSVVDTDDPDETFFEGSVPPGLTMLDGTAPDPETCNCRLQQLLRELTAPRSGVNFDLGVFSLRDINYTLPPPGGSGGGNPAPPSDTTAPAVPSALTVVPKVGSAELAWDAVADADLNGYKLYASTDGGLTWNVDATVGKTTHYTAARLTGGISYTFAVSAYDGNGNESARSASVIAVPLPEPDTTPPAVPAGLTAAPAADSVELHWTTVPDADLAGYRVYLSDNDGVTWSPVLAPASASVQETHYAVTGLTPGATYAFAVTALDRNGNESGKSAVAKATALAEKDTVPPSVPTGLAAAPGVGQVNLTWDAVNDRDTAGYRVYQSADGVNWDGGTNVDLHTVYAAAGLTVGTTYWFAVSALDAAGNESARSASVNAVPLSEPDTTPPAVPEGLTADAAVGSAELHWAAVPDADLAGYRVYSSTDDGVTWSPIPGAIQEAHYTAAGLAAGVEYSFAVTALDQSGNESAKSAAAKATSLPGEDTVPPSVPSGLTAAGGVGQIDLTWDAVGDIDVLGYKVYQSTDGENWDTGTGVGLQTAFTATGLSAGMTYWFAVSAYDTNDNESPRSSGVSAVPLPEPDTMPPSVPEGLTAAVGIGSVELHWTAVPDADLAGYNVYLSDNGGVTWSPVPASVQEAHYTFDGLLSGIEYTFAVSALDASGNESGTSSVVRATVLTGEDTVPPSVPTGFAALAGADFVNLTWNAVSDGDLAGYKVYQSTDGVNWDGGTNVGLQTAYAAAGLTSGTTYWFAVSALDAAGNESAMSDALQAVPVVPEDLPPDPSGLATTIPEDGSATFASTVAFLYEGSQPIQTDVTPGALEPDRVGVLRGTVRDAANRPLPGVTVSVLGHEAWGRTLSRADGLFDLAVNGGGTITVVYEKSGYIAIQRKASVPAADYASLPDVTMIPYDTQVTTVSFDGGPGDIQVARGSVTTDADGSRQATLLIPGGTTASMKLPDGTVQPVSSLNIRATEYTVGDNGEQAMPGELPAYVGYTYAVELSADEAVTAGASEVRFDKPLYMYVDNFLNFPVGQVVPVGYYDRQAGAWVPSDNGKIVQILSIDGGVAAVDIDGDQQADDDAQLAAFGLTLEERTKLASLYEPGKTLWRAPIEHFTPWDCNWPFGPPDNAPIPPDDGPGPDPDKPKKDDDCKKKGSVIGCQGQTLGEMVPITGTGMNLNYSSRNAEGYAKKSTLSIPVSDGSLSSIVKGIVVVIEIAGVKTELTVPIGQRSVSYPWDGLDAYKRKVKGSSPYKVTVMYLFTPQYYSSKSDFDRSFAQVGGNAVIGSRGAWNVTTEREWHGVIESPFNPYEDGGIAGWSLDAQHYYDPDTDTLLKGDGTVVSGTKDVYIPKEIPLRPSPEDPSVGIAQANKGLKTPLIGPDGTIYLNAWHIQDTEAPFYYETDIFRLDDNGHAERVDSKRDIRSFDFFTIDSEGTMYGSTVGDYRVWRKRTTDNDWVVFAGNGKFSADQAAVHDGDLAVNVEFGFPHAMKTTPDGNLYFIDNRALYRITKDGRIYKYGMAAYSFQYPTGIDNGLLAKDNVGNVDDLAVGPDGSLFVTDMLNCIPNAPCDVHNRIRKISPDGTISLIVGAGNANVALADGVKAESAAFAIADNHFESDAHGNLFFVAKDRLYKANPSGFIVEVNDGSVERLRRTVAVGFSLHLQSVGPDGDLLLRIDDPIANDGFRLLRLQSSQNGGITQVADASGLQFYEFDTLSGRHLRTVNAMTGGLINQLEYDAEGRLSSVTDRDGNVVKVERDSEGTPKAIVAPGGQRTVLTVEQGRLAGVINPANETYSMKYEANGLLKSFTDPNLQVRRYGYDDSGYLTSAENPMTGVSMLSRETFDDGYRVIFTNPGNETTTYEVRTVDSDLVSTNTDPSGAQTVSVLKEDGSEDIVYPDGTHVTMVLAPDPRWGWSAPVYKQITVTSPAGRHWTFEETREVALRDPEQLTSLGSMINTYKKTESSPLGTTTAVSTVSYDAMTQKYTETSAEGSVLITSLNEKGRVKSIEESGSAIDPIVYTYDAKGRLAEVHQGNQFIKRVFDEHNRIVQTTDASGQTMSYSYDNADRITGIRLPSGQTIRKAYDKRGNLTKIIAPNGTEYRQTVNEMDQFNGFYTDGASEGLTVQYTPQGDLDKSVLASGRSVDYQSDGTGRIQSMIDDEISRTFSYVGQNDLVGTMQSTTASNPSSLQSQTVDFQYEGADITGMTWSGSANGQFNYTYDGMFRMRNIRSVINGVTKDTPIAWDKDHQLTQFGPFTYNRTGSGAGRRVGSISDGAMDASLTYDRQGRVASISYTLNGDYVYKLEYEYNLKGQVVEQKTTTPEELVTESYQYDADGELTAVNRSGSAGANQQESYAYDVNQNRLSRELTGSSAVASQYGENDTLERVGTTEYQFDADGYLAQRGTDTFHYAVKGELLEATVGGTDVRYNYDAMGRRVAREAKGHTIQYLYGNLGSPYQVTATVDTSGGKSVTTDYYYNEDGLLLAIERDNTRYYVVTDMVGTPQRILKADKTVVKTLQYDSFGVLVSDSAPAFSLSIGFAGGIADDTTGLVRFGFRDYDPQSGRWTTRDPILFDGGQVNLYAYVHNNPIQFRDECGLFCVGYSAYDVIGGGGKACISTEGASVCGEVGLGMGGGWEISPLEAISSDSIEEEISIKATVGPTSLTEGFKIALEFGDCGKNDVTVSPITKVDAGPLSFDVNKWRDSTFDPKKLGSNYKNWFKEEGMKAEAAWKLRGCAQHKW